MTCFVTWLQKHCSGGDSTQIIRLETLWTSGLQTEFRSLKVAHHVSAHSKSSHQQKKAKTENTTWHFEEMFDVKHVDSGDFFQFDIDDNVKKQTELKK